MRDNHSLPRPNEQLPAAVVGEVMRVIRTLRYNSSRDYVVQGIGRGEFADDVITLTNAEGMLLCKLLGLFVPYGWGVYE